MSHASSRIPFFGRFISVVPALLLLCVAATFAQEITDSSQANNEPLRVVLTGSAPFTDYVEGRKAEGIAVSLWERAAAESGLTYQYTYVPSVREAIRGVNKGDYDLAVGPISMTDERSLIVDFTVPYYVAHVGVVSRDESINVWGIIKPFLSNSFIIAAGTLFFVLFLFANILWLVERRENELIPDTWLRGVGSGIWLALVTFTTVGYGDIAPATTRGRIVTGIWMLVAMVTASSLTAGIATTFTVVSLSTDQIESVEDLHNHDVVCVDGTVFEDFIRVSGGRLHTAPTVTEALKMLESGAVSAFCDDYPVIRHELHKQGKLSEDLNLTELKTRDDFFAFCLRHSRTGLRRQVNTAMLHLRETGFSDTLMAKWGLAVKK